MSGANAISGITVTGALLEMEAAEPGAKSALNPTAADIYGTLFLASPMRLWARRVSSRESQD